ncbi:MAG: hypothetical protein P8Z81_04620 [Deinococcales bacterium]
MPVSVHRVRYYYATLEEIPGQTYGVLSQLAACGVNLLAFTAAPVGPTHVQWSLFPADTKEFEAVAHDIGLPVSAVQDALLVQGDDRLGALAELHERLSTAKVDVYATSGVTTGAGRFGYVIYVKPDQVDRAADALHAVAT